ncbi:MAG: DUF3795 domain-containing protein [Candidatus Bathyarchaeota archaeon]|nr:DUF3795 domain-containing protein [Candidatus Bathyarchaeota archaeon]
MNPKYVEVGVCGLSCRLCPSYNSQAQSRCGGCKSPERMQVGCPFITCAVKKKGLDFCWECKESSSCEKWRAHRDASRAADSFKCYQTLEADIKFVLQHGIDCFEEQQKVRWRLLNEMLCEFNEGRSKSLFCVVATVFSVEELEQILTAARGNSKGLQIKEKARVMHSIIQGVADKRGYCLKLRKNTTTL